MYVQNFKYCGAILDQLMGEQGLNALEQITRRIGLGSASQDN